MVCVKTVISVKISRFPGHVTHATTLCCCRRLIQTRYKGRYYVLNCQNCWAYANKRRSYWDANIVSK